MTSYEVIYGRFLNSVTDFNLAELDDHTLSEMLKNWLHTAIVKTRTSSDLTARDDEDDVIKGLSLGAEDYMTKPFSTKELLVRVKNIILRNNKISIINVKDISFDLNKMIVSKNGKEIDLTSLELKILHLLFNNIGKVVRRNTILDKIWEWTGNDVDNHTITVYLKRIREKLGTDIIITIKGIGYRIDEE